MLQAFRRTNKVRKRVVVVLDGASTKAGAEMGKE